MSAERINQIIAIIFFLLAVFSFICGLVFYAFLEEPWCMLVMLASIPFAGIAYYANN